MRKGVGLSHFPLFPKRRFPCLLYNRVLQCYFLQLHGSPLHQCILAQIVLYLCLSILCRRSPSFSLHMHAFLVVCRAGQATTLVLPSTEVLPFSSLFCKSFPSRIKSDLINPSSFLFRKWSKYVLSKCGTYLRLSASPGTLPMSFFYKFLFYILLTALVIGNNTRSPQEDKLKKDNR